MEEEPGLAVEVTEMEEEPDLAVEVTEAPVEPPARLEIPVETAVTGRRTRGKTTGGGERTTGEPGGTRADRGRMEVAAAYGQNDFTFRLRYFAVRVRPRVGNPMPLNSLRILDITHPSLCLLGSAIGGLIIVMG